MVYHAKSFGRRRLLGSFLRRRLPWQQTQPYLHALVCYYRIRMAFGPDKSLCRPSGTDKSPPQPSSSPTAYRTLEVATDGGENNSPGNGSVIALGPGDPSRDQSTEPESDLHTSGSLTPAG
ncbi:hypothetical protein B0T18DRAFT_251381 [Schizothecium vesticola]|uniref:Uncharacterized protein n=1 Tax=Schizothecium vesticola TaxID=314040 RepID=A0AA40BQT5_9PEZI|nr:hypothetical protein B0T18DRAFT_251381 [Schizothecium vesticola]